jgi:hypothetical protein
MANEIGSTLGPKALNQVEKTVREVARRLRNETPQRGRWQHRSSAQFAFGVLSQDSGQDDSVLPITLYKTADLATFASITCGSTSSGSGSGSGSGDNAFLDMELSLCSERGSVMALVPAGYKAGNVGLAKWPICNAGGSGSGSGSGIADWTGWVVLFGKRSRCVVEVPTAIECCPITGLKFTRYSRHWYFGGGLSDRLDPCTSGSGSGSGS